MKVLELLKETGGTGDSERTGLKGVIYEIKQKRRLSSHKPFESLSSVMAFRLLRFFLGCCVDCSQYVFIRCC